MLIPTKLCKARGSKLFQLGNYELKAISSLGVGAAKKYFGPMDIV